MLPSASSLAAVLMPCASSNLCRYNPNLDIPYPCSPILLRCQDSLGPGPMGRSCELSLTPLPGDSGVPAYGNILLTLCRTTPLHPKKTTQLFSPLYSLLPIAAAADSQNRRWGGMSVHRVGPGSAVTSLPPRLAASLCFSALAGSCPSPRSSIGPRRPL